MDISLLICTRNGAATIADAIACIGRQINIDEKSYEVIVVDNGSTDDTARLASEALTRLRCRSVFVTESREGKVSAFLRGMAISTAPLVSIIDDDNQIGEEFLWRTLAMFKEFPQVGIVGSHNTILADAVPNWFEHAADGYFGCGKPWLEGVIQPIDDYRMVASGGVTAGAGMTFRKEPLLEALSKGFSFTNDGLRGSKLAGGEDLELCLLLRYYGFWLGMDTRITLRHRIQPSRLNWPYARRLFRSVGAAAMILDTYGPLTTGEFSSTALSRLQGTWVWLAARRLRRLVTLLPAGVRALAQGRVIDPFWMGWDANWGALRYILRERSRYTRRLDAVLEGEWRTLRFLPGQSQKCTADY